VVSLETCRCRQVISTETIIILINQLFLSSNSNDNELCYITAGRGANIANTAVMDQFPNLREYANHVAAGVRVIMCILIHTDLLQ